MQVRPARRSRCEEASDGSFTHVYRGLDFVLQPWTLPPVPDLACLRPPRADKKKLMFVATTCACWEEEEEMAEPDPDFWLCCDVESEMFGKLL